MPNAKILFLHPARTRPGQDVGSERADGVAVSVQHLPAIAIARVSGNIDGPNTARWAASFDRLIAQGLPYIVDLTGVDVVDRDGIRALLRLRRQCVNARRAWVLVVSTSTRMAVPAAQLSQRLPIAASMSDALDQFATAQQLPASSPRITAREVTRC
ncbi:STAS domain-containing protein [Mycolicibacterium gilvum]|uniref:STAS domain-containing protein n=1 Tax=Mycolicibacterium gilvum TaxID=1804 RepID=UPI00404662D1